MAAPTITTGILTGGSSSHQTSAEEVNAHATDFVSEGVVGTFTNTSGVAPSTGAFAVNAQGTPDTTVQISTGVAYVTATPTSQNSQALRIKCTVAGSLTISANASGSTKYDWIYISVSATNAANPNSGADNVATIVASRSSSASSDDGTPPTYGYPIAVVTVANGFSTITNGNIRDIRTNCIVNLGSTSVSSGWTDLGYTPNTVTYNGNRSYNLVFSSVDLTSTLSTGMRLKSTRLVSAPTKCTDLESSSSQYYNKTSPNKSTFTDDFVAMAWVKLESYPAANGYTVISRYNGTSGWLLDINTSGQVKLIGLNAGAANFSQVLSNQAVPLGRWVHIAAQLDMSAFTATPTTSYIMFNGVDVPSSVTRGGTNPTALVQAGNLEVGGTNGGTQPFDGKLAQVAFFTAKVTQANVVTYISQGLAGTETNLGSAYSFDNSINDLNSTTPNNLTAQNSAVATSADSPFAQDDIGTPNGTTDYAIITGKSFSTDTTLTVQVPEGNTIPTSGGVSAMSYSTHKNPYGFLGGVNRWAIIVMDRNAPSTSSTSLTSFSQQIVTPTGAWLVSLKAFMTFSTSGNSRYAKVTLSSDATNETNEFLSIGIGGQDSGASIMRSSGYAEELVYSSSAVTFTLMGVCSGSGVSVGLYPNSYVPTTLKAVCAYL